MKEPNDDNLTVSPFSRQSVISFKTSSTNADDSLSDSPTCRYTAPDRSTRVTVFRVPVIACPNSRRRKFVSEIKRLLTRGQWCSAPVRRPRRSTSHRVHEGTGRGTLRHHRPVHQRQSDQDKRPCA